MAAAAAIHDDEPPLIADAEVEERRLVALGRTVGRSVTQAALSPRDPWGPRTSQFFLSCGCCPARLVADRNARLPLQRKPNMS